jgi:hypothetical protein
LPSAALGEIVMPVGSGRTRWIVTAVSVVVLGALGAASLATADEEVFQTGKLRSDGVMTVGQPETVVIKGLPPRRKVRIAIFSNAQRCQNFRNAFCIPAAGKRVAGTPRFRTSGKGRARLTFLMPAAYDVLNLKNFKTEHVSFTNGEPLLVSATVDTSARRHGESVHLIGIAQGSAVAEVPPPPAPPAP